MSNPPAPHASGRRALGARGWIAIAIAAVAIIAVVAVLVMVFDGPRKNREVVQSLAATPSLEWPEALVPRPAHSTRHEDYLGLLVVSTGWDLDDSEVSCLYVSRDGSGTLESFDQSCGSGSLRPTVQVIVGPQSPAALAGRYATGTTLRFVLDDREVRVITATDHSA